MTGPTAAESQGRAAGPAAQRAPHAAVGNDRLPPTRVLVIGGGAAGLVAAWDCARPGFEVTLVEASERTGGSVAAHEVAGVTLDVGAESFATRGGAVEELLGDLGLRDRIVAPNPAGAWLHAAGRSVPLPRGGMLGIPASPLARDVIAAIGWRGALRAYADRLVPVMKIGREENLARLVARRMGRAVLDDLVAPVVTGVYSTPVEDLDVEAAVPGLNGALTRAGSLSGAVAELRLAAARRAKEAGTGSKPGSAVLGLQGGMHTLVAALVEGLRARGGRIVTGTRALAVRPLSADDEGQTPPAFGPGWRVETAGGESLTADAVVVAAPQAEAVALLAEASEAAVGLAALAWPQAGRVDIVTLVLDQPALDAAPRGTGLLVAQGTRVQAKALTHSSAKWPWLAELLGPHRHALRLSYGRAGALRSERDDAGLRARALVDASLLLGVPIDDSMVVGFDRTAWQMYPTLARGRRDRLDAALAVARELDGVEVTGAWVTGTGLASVVAGARQAARQIRGLRWNALTTALPGAAEGL